MVHKYTLAKGREQVTDRYKVQTNTKLKPIYNAFPGSSLPVITNTNPDVFEFLQWGMIPYDSMDPMIGEKLTHAKIELIKAKKPFADLIETNRCLIPADGFIIWGNDSKPFQVSLKSKEVFSIAGVWDSWNDEFNDTSFLRTFSIITTQAMDLINSISERMPAIINKDEEAKWLSDGISKDEALGIIHDTKPEEWIIKPISQDIVDSNDNKQELLNEQNVQSPGQSFDLFT